MKTAYTGDPYASDSLYNAATDSAGQLIAGGINETASVGSNNGPNASAGYSVQIWDSNGNIDPSLDASASATAMETSDSTVDAKLASASVDLSANSDGLSGDANASGASVTVNEGTAGVDPMSGTTSVSFMNASADLGLSWSGPDLGANGGAMASVLQGSQTLNVAIPGTQQDLSLTGTAVIAGIGGEEDLKVGTDGNEFEEGQTGAYGFGLGFDVKLAKAKGAAQNNNASKPSKCSS